MSYVADISTTNFRSRESQNASHGNAMLTNLIKIKKRAIYANKASYYPLLAFLNFARKLLVGTLYNQWLQGDIFCSILKAEDDLNYKKLRILHQNTVRGAIHEVSS